MKQVYTSIILLITMLFGALSIAQESQKNFINYQGIARNSDNAIMASEAMTIKIALKFGAANTAAVYEESHSITTDANGVFSLLIGNGGPDLGDYNSLPWGSDATFVTVSMNGNELGTTEMMAVPYAISSGDANNQWHTLGDDIENKNGGNVFVTGSLYASKDLSLASGAAVNEFSTDITLGSNSDEIVPTQKAIKTYVDNQLGGTGGGSDNQNAAEVPYDNSISGLTAATTQDAIDELVTGGSVDADADPSNEIQDISLLGTELTISDGSTIDLAPIFPPGGTDDQNADEVPYDNTASGLVASDAQAAIDELASGGLVDTDDQDLSLLGTTLQITDGTSVDLSAIIPPGGTDDQDAGEVPYDNTTSGLTASDAQAAIDELASGGLVDTDDQGLVLAGDLLTIEDGSGSVDLSAYKDVDVTTKTGILLGDGSNISGLIGTADGQVAKWNAGTSEWEAGTDDTGGGGSVWTDNGANVHVLGTNVGIGTNNPTARLDVDGVIRTRDLSGAGERNVVADADGNLIIGAAGGGSSVWSENGSDIYFDGGNVGIGTTAPGAPLHLISNSATSIILKTDSPDNYMSYRNNEGAIGYSGIYNGDKDMDFGTHGINSTGKVHLVAGADPKLTVAANGNVGVGTTSPATNFEVSGTGTVRHRMTSTNAGTVSLQWMRTGAANTDWMFTAGDDRMEWAYSTSDLSGGAVHSRLLDDGTFDVVKGIRSGDLTGIGERNVVADADGNLIIAAGGFPSDIRLKKDIEVLPYGLKQILQLEPKIYGWIDDRYSGSKSLGLIAQKVRQIIPEIVHEKDNAEKSLSLSYTELIPVIISAVKEQHEIIVGQARRISDLEERLTKLEPKTRN